MLGSTMYQIVIIMNWKYVYLVKRIVGDGSSDGGGCGRRNSIRCNYFRKHSNVKFNRLVVWLKVRC